MDQKELTHTSSDSVGAAENKFFNNIDCICNKSPDGKIFKFILKGAQPESAL